MRSRCSVCSRLWRNRSLAAETVENLRLLTTDGREGTRGPSPPSPLMVNCRGGSFISKLTFFLQNFYGYYPTARAPAVSVTTFAVEASFASCASSALNWTPVVAVNSARSTSKGANL